MAKTPRFTFRLVPAGIVKIERSPEMAAFINKVARAVLESAKATPEVPWWYLRSLGMDPATPGAYPMAAAVYSNDSRWHLFEFGTIYNGPYRPLTRAVTDTGLRFED